ncbi:MAG TPA: TIGR02677 family protein [Candidatus Scybalocola faecavium]|nr:TIGR02677 family protein [Candidatus Scybalocola faecavium]
MEVTEKLTRPLTEVKYLNADNVDRYRCIMRIFFENYEKMRYWLYEEDVFEAMKADPYFAGYRQEQCRQDLEALAEWKNLIPSQDTRKVATLAEFNNRNYRYQMSEYSVQIERLVLQLENLFIEGASLEPTLLERLRIAVGKFRSMAQEKDNGVVYRWWKDLRDDFIRLNQNYKDYIRDLNSVRAEEMMRTQEFLVFKDRLVDYLRNFIKGLQRNTGVIETELRALPENVVDIVLDKVLAYEKSIPRMEEVNETMFKKSYRDRFDSIHDWFVSENGRENEAGKLFDATNDMIRRITRYAALLSERSAFGANRREEYRKAASIFMKCQTLSQAHEMAAMVFGVECPRHLRGEMARETDSMNSGVYEERPETFTIKPRIRTYREKTRRSAMTDHSRQKAETRQQIMDNLQAESKKLALLEKDGRIDFAKLPVIEARIREILLKWLSDALEDGDFMGRTDDGRQFRLDFSHGKEKCVVHCEDGNFTMPALSMVFLEEQS